MTELDDTMLHVPARNIPIPQSVSGYAAAQLGMGRREIPPFPDLDDTSGWRELIRAGDAEMLGGLSFLENPDTVVEEIDVAGVRVFVATPTVAVPEDPRVHLDCHGGALIMGGGDVCRLLAGLLAERIHMTVWSVDYRMPPDHPFPAALDDCVAVYAHLLRMRAAEQIVVGGGSAGGNLAAALVLRARDEGLPLPAATVLVSPEVDLTESGDTFQTNLGVDTTLARSLMPANLLYAGGHDLAHPHLSPLFGDVAKGFPPTFLASGTRDLFLSNTVRMHRNLRAAGVPSELHLTEAAPHGGFIGAPEDLEILDDMIEFIGRHCPVA
jgi:acetyl esterase/lipase